MKKLMMLAVAGMFSVSAAAYACDGKDHQQAKTEKAAKVAKKDQKQETAPKDQKKS